MTTSDLLNSIDTNITANHSGAITGTILNTLLKDMTNTLSGTSYYAFPNDPDTPITTDDIGKLAMNDGSGTAKVYALNSAEDAVAGSWTITLTSDNWTDLSITSEIDIVNVDGDKTKIKQTEWRDGATPTIALEELNLMKTKLESYDLGLTCAIVGTDTLTIIESTPNGNIVSVQDFPDDSFFIVQYSTPASPISGSAFPLGKIVGIQDSNVLISSAMVETYTLEGAIDLDNSYYNLSNYGALLQGGDGQNLISTLSKFAAVPGSDGKVKSLDIAIYNSNQPILYSFRAQILGLILTSTGSTVTVMHCAALSPVFAAFLRLNWLGEQGG